MTISTVKYEAEERMEERSGPISHLGYRLFEKSDRDVWDYILLTIFAIGLLIVMVFKNTKSYVLSRAKDEVLLEENNLDLVESIEIEEKPLKIEKLEERNDLKIDELKEDYATLVEEKKEDKNLFPRSAKRYNTYNKYKPKKSKEKDV